MDRYILKTGMASMWGRSINAKERLYQNIQQKKNQRNKK
jgi:hypothetical protein